MTTTSPKANSGTARFRDNAQKWLKEPSTYMAIVTLALVVTNTILALKTQRLTLSSYLTVNEMSPPSVFVDKVTKVTEAIFSPTIENTGPTPARNVRTWLGWDQWRGNGGEWSVQAPMLPPNGLGMGHNPVRLSIGPKAKMAGIAHTVALPGRALNDLKGGKTALYIYGRLKYEDVFGGDHTSNYCFVLGRKDAASAEEVPIQFCGGLANCTDDDCPEEMKGRPAAAPPRSWQTTEAGAQRGEPTAARVEPVEGSDVKKPGPKPR